MSFQIIWSDQAEIQLDKIFDYYSVNVSVRVAKTLLRKLINEPAKLLTIPEISQREELLLDRKNEYPIWFVKITKSFIPLIQKRNK